MIQEKLYEVSVRKAKYPIKGRPWTIAVGPNEIGAFRTESEAEPMRSAVAGGWIATLDAEGRCCGRKPLPYKIPKPHNFCVRCHACYDAKGVQVSGWAWKKGSDGKFRYAERFDRSANNPRWPRDED